MSGARTAASNSGPIAAGSPNEIRHNPEVLAAYLGGVLTILSPCILPVLPFVFARSEQKFLTNGLPMLAGMAITFAAIATLAATSDRLRARLIRAQRFSTGECPASANANANSVAV